MSEGGGWSNPSRWEVVSRGSPGTDAGAGRPSRGTARLLEVRGTLRGLGESPLKTLQGRIINKDFLTKTLPWLLVLAPFRLDRDRLLSRRNLMVVGLAIFLRYALGQIVEGVEVNIGFGRDTYSRMVNRAEQKGPVQDRPLAERTLERYANSDLTGLVASLSKEEVVSILRRRGTPLPEAPGQQGSLVIISDEVLESRIIPALDALDRSARSGQDRYSVGKSPITLHPESEEMRRVLNLGPKERALLVEVSYHKNGQRQTAVTIAVFAEGLDGNLAMVDLADLVTTSDNKVVVAFLDSGRTKQFANAVKSHNEVHKALQLMTNNPPSAYAVSVLARAAVAMALSPGKAESGPTLVRDLDHPLRRRPVTAIVPPRRL